MSMMTTSSIPTVCIQPLLGLCYHCSKGSSFLPSSALLSLETPLWGRTGLRRVCTSCSVQKHPWQGLRAAVGIERSGTTAHVGVFRACQGPLHKPRADAAGDAVGKSGLFHRGGLSNLDGAVLSLVQGHQNEVFLLALHILVGHLLELLIRDGDASFVAYLQTPLVCRRVAPARLHIGEALDCQDSLTAFVSEQAVLDLDFLRELDGSPDSSKHAKDEDNDTD
mmetsp:Transcript_17195/g.37668  ORF Transcript_17195/g.37668 Transcript_17195/m.37668 type:complete len:223 (-) Transcript_17195:280-948(-)